MPDNRDRYIVHHTPLGRVFILSYDEALTPETAAHRPEPSDESSDEEINDLPASDVTVVDAEGPPNPEERFITRATGFASRFFHRPDPERERMRQATRQATRQAMYAQLEAMESDLERYLQHFDASARAAPGDEAAPTPDTASPPDSAARSASDETNDPGAHRDTDTVIDLDEPTDR